MRKILIIFFETICALTVNAQLKAINANYDFGDVCDTTKNLAHTFQVTNTSDNPACIKRIIFSCSCLTPIYSCDTIPPDSTQFITMYLDTKMIKGDFKKPFVIKDSSGKNIYASLSGRMVSLDDIENKIDSIR